MVSRFIKEAILDPGITADRIRRWTARIVASNLTVAYAQLRAVGKSEKDAEEEIRTFYTSLKVEIRAFTYTT